MHIEEARDRELIALRTSLKNERDELAKASAQVAREKDLLTSSVAKAVEAAAKQERALHAKKLAIATRNARAQEKEKLKTFARHLLEQHVSLEHARSVLAAGEVELKQEKEGLRKATVAAVAAVTKRERVLRAKAVADAGHRARADEQPKHQREIRELTRRLDAAKARKTLSRVGIEADAKLADLLKEQFPSDVIVPTRGSRTGDVLQTVRYNGRDAGLIFWERKTGAKITKAFVTKLRSDMLKRQADYGILLGDGYYRKGFYGCDVDGNVAVINAHMIRPIADLLRKSLIAMHLSGIAANSRIGVANRLLAYVTSGDFRRRMTRFVEMAEALLRLHDADKIYHTQYWEQIEVIYREYQVSSADIHAGLGKVIAGLPPGRAA